MQVVPGTWQYMLGDVLLVAVIYEPNRHRQVQLPAGRWIDWWDNAKVHTGPGTIEVDVPDDRYPVFIRAGSVHPAQRDKRPRGPRLEGIRGRHHAGHLPGTRHGRGIRALGSCGRRQAHEADGRVADRKLTVHLNGGLARKYVLRVLADKAPRSVAIDNKAMPHDAWRHDAGDRRLWITTGLVRDAEVQIHLE